MTFSGEQGQTIRQLIGAHVLRRVAMCCLASPKGRRQHLAVSHEKGKVMNDQSPARGSNYENSGLILFCSTGNLYVTCLPQPLLKLYTIICYFGACSLDYSSSAVSAVEAS